MRVGVSESEIEAARHLAAEGNGGAVVDARGFALVHVDCTELRNRAGKGIDARRKWASQAGAELPGGKSFHRAIAEQV